MRSAVVLFVVCLGGLALSQPAERNWRPNFKPPNFDKVKETLQKFGDKVHEDMSLAEAKAQAMIDSLKHQFHQGMAGMFGQKPKPPPAQPGPKPDPALEPCTDDAQPKPETDETEHNIDVAAVETILKPEQSIDAAAVETTLKPEQSIDVAAAETTLKPEQSIYAAAVETTLKPEESIDATAVETTLKPEESIDATAVETTLKPEESIDAAAVETTLKPEESIDAAAVETTLKPGQSIDVAAVETTLKPEESIYAAAVETTLKPGQSIDAAAVETTLKPEESIDAAAVETTLKPEESIDASAVETTLKPEESIDASAVETTLKPEESIDAAAVETTLKPEENIDAAAVETTLKPEESIDASAVETTLKPEESIDAAAVETTLKPEESIDAAAVETTLKPEESIDAATVETTLKLEQTTVVPAEKPSFSITDLLIPVPVEKIEAVAGDPVYLPCDITPPPRGTESGTVTPGSSTDSVQLVLWSREDMTSPIFTVDARERSWKQAVKWSDDNVFGNRAYFMPEKKPAELGVDHVKESDAGIYRCRVDFLVAQTRFSRINLTVIVPPTSMKIVDEKGLEKNGIAGPYEEGSVLNLQCKVYGGKPRPSVSWWRGEELLTNYSTSSSIGEPHIFSLLVINNLGRSDLGSQLTCLARNNNKTLPLSATVHVDMNFKPLEVKISEKNQPLSAGRLTHLQCNSTGSRPPAKLTWWRNGQRMEKTKDETSGDGNTTMSTLTFTPTKEDDGKNITCMAENPMMPKTPPITDYFTLHIQYTPEAEIRLGSSLKPDEIREGNDVYFDCQVKAVPSVYKVEWRHNDRPLNHNIGQGVVISDKSLALQGVSRSSAGNYSCVGYNTEGDGKSPPFYLDVMYAPTCKPLQPRVHGVAKQERVNISCEVDANPRDVTYRWTFNNSADGMGVASGRIQSHGATSVVTYTPLSDLDYGTLLCWATNRIGHQKVPCVFHIIAAGKPDQVHNCSIGNISKVSFSLRCQEGFNGGLHQSFFVEVYEPDATEPTVNFSSAVPQFQVYGLQPGINYEARVYSANAKGRSEPVLLPAPTVRLPEKQLTAERERPRAGFKMTPVLMVTCGVVGSLFLVACVVAGVLRLQCSRDDRPRVKADQSGGPKPLASSPKGELSSLEPDERNPDIIPQPNSGCDEDEHEFVRKRQLISTIETRTSPSRSLLQPGPYPGYCTLRNGGLPLQDLSNIPPTKPQNHPEYKEILARRTQAELCKAIERLNKKLVSGDGMYPGCTTLPRGWGGVRGGPPHRGVQVLPASHQTEGGLLLGGPPALPLASPPILLGDSSATVGPGTPLMAAKRESQV